VRALRITGDRPGAIFVNLGDAPAKVRFPAGMSGRWDLTTLSAPATAEPGWVPGGEPEVSESTATGAVTLPAHSIVRAVAH
jgi:hypothetical protein